MTTPEDRTLPRADTPAGGLRDQLRRQRVILLKDHKKKLDIPGYNGLLVAEYQPIKWDKIQELGKKISKMPDDAQTLIAAADTIINACLGIYGRDGGKLRPLWDIYPEVGDPEVPVRYDERLVVALELDIPDEPVHRSARNILFTTFNNNIAVINHAQELSTWMSDVTKDIDEEFLAGEATGAAL